MLVFLTCLRFDNVCAFSDHPVRSQHSSRKRPIRKQAFFRHHASSFPAGKVDDPDEWLRCVSDSLEQYYGKSLYDELSVSGPGAIHNNERYVVISHGTQDDPVYNYGNKAGLLFFGYPEHEFVQLPSRYSAPSGALRQDRSQIVQHVLDHGWTIIDEAIRQNKARESFRVRRILYFNVNDDDGKRIGQAATFDRELIEPFSEGAPEKD